MAENQPAVAAMVIAFHRKDATRVPGASRCLTSLDRMDVSTWRDRARLAGYDRMVIHDRDDGDAAEVGNFLSVYRCGDSWSRWCFAREGMSVRAWCGVSSIDVGSWRTLGEALSAVLRGIPQPDVELPSATIIHFTPRTQSRAERAA